MRFIGILLLLLVLMGSCRKDTIPECASNGLEGELCKELVWMNGIYQFSLYYSYFEDGATIEKKIRVEGNSTDEVYYYTYTTNNDTLITRVDLHDDNKVEFVSQKTEVNGKEVKNTVGDLTTISEYDDSLLVEQKIYKGEILTERKVFQYFFNTNTVYTIRVYNEYDALLKESTFNIVSDSEQVEEIRDGNGILLGSVVSLIQNDLLLSRFERDENGVLETKTIWTYENNKIKRAEKFDINGNLVELVEKQYIMN